MEEYVSPEALADGTALLVLKMKYLQTRDKRELFPLLNCLRDSWVFVPGDVMDSDGSDIIRMRPEFLTSRDGKRWLPIFSQAEQLPEEYRRRYSILRMDVPQCLEMAHAASDLSGIVLDAFTSPVTLPFEAADLIPQIPSMLKPDKSNG